MNFLTIPHGYYDNLRERLQKAKISLNKDMDVVRYHTELDPLYLNAGVISICIMFMHYTLSCRS